MKDGILYCRISTTVFPKSSFTSENLDCNLPYVCNDELLHLSVNVVFGSEPLIIPTLLSPLTYDLSL